MFQESARLAIPLSVKADATHLGVCLESCSPVDTHKQVDAAWIQAVMTVSVMSSLGADPEGPFT